MNKSHHLYLTLAIVIPVIMIAIVVFNILFFRTQLTPQYHFIYMTNTAYSWACYESIKKELFPNENKSSTATKKSEDCTGVKIFEYDFSNDKSSPVTLAQVKKMKLQSTKNRLSPDGYTIGYCNTTGVVDWFPGFSSDSICIRKDNASERVDIPASKSFFIGWKLN